MSRAGGVVRFPDGTLKYWMYDGTCDVIWPRLFPTNREAWDAYKNTRHNDFDWEETFYPPEGYEPGEVFTVDIYEDYGGGASWVGTASHDYILAPTYDRFDLQYDHGNIETSWTLDTDPDWVRWDAGIDP